MGGGLRTQEATRQTGAFRSGYWERWLLEVNVLLYCVGALFLKLELEFCTDIMIIHILHEFTSMACYLLN